MIRNKKMLRAIIFGGLLLPFLATPPLPAGLRQETLKMHVQIDGVDFGGFDQIPNIEALSAQASAGKNTQSHRKITLKRDFVTDRSLYLWATNAMQAHNGLRDIQLVMKNSGGDEVSRYVLRLCQPLAWSVEVANPALGGFHETVDFAVQEITSF